MRASLSPRGVQAQITGGLCVALTANSPILSCVSLRQHWWHQGNPAPRCCCCCCSEQVRDAGSLSTCPTPSSPSQGSGPSHTPGLGSQRGDWILPREALSLQSREGRLQAAEQSCGPVGQAIYRCLPAVPSAGLMKPGRAQGGWARAGIMTSIRPAGPVPGQTGSLCSQSM